jgi:hypothetical protein
MSNFKPNLTSFTCCLTCVGHGQDAWAGVLELEVLIRELGPVDGLAASAIAGGEVTTCTSYVADQWRSRYNQHKNIQ